MSSRRLLQGRTYRAMFSVTLVMGFKIAKVEFKGRINAGLITKGEKVELAAELSLHIKSITYKEHLIN